MDGEAFLTYFHPRMRMPMSRKAWIYLGSALGLAGMWLFPVPVHAQAPAAQDNSRGVENVVVTARRRAETTLSDGDDMGEMTIMQMPDTAPC